MIIEAMHAECRRFRMKFKIVLILYSAIVR